MGLLDHLLDGFHPVGNGTGKLLRRNVKRAETLLAEGDRATARIVGIRVRDQTDENPDLHEFALAVGDTVLGCRQDFGDLTREIRLGMEVPVRLGDGRVIVDAPAMGSAEDGAWGYKALDDPPARGIEDDHSDLAKDRRRGVAATLTVLDAERSVVLGMRAQNVDLHVRVEGAGDAPYETVLKRVLVPFYAAHLVEPGSVVPCVVRDGRPDKVRIDWPAGAVADPGVGRPAAAVLVDAPGEVEEVVGAGAPAADWSEEGLAADDFGSEAGVAFGTWVAVEAGLVRDRVRPADAEDYAQTHGVPAGAWPAAQSAWQSRMMRDPRVGARFGSAYQDAVKRR